MIGGYNGKRHADTCHLAFVNHKASFQKVHFVFM